MTNWGIFQQLSQQIKLAETTDYITNLVQPAAANIKGSYVEISSAIPFDSEGLILQFVSTSYVADNLFDIAIGALGLEVDIISNVVASHSSAFHVGKRYEFPLKLKAGTRLSGRSQGTSTSAQNHRMAIHLLRGSWTYNRGFAVCDTYGANTADSGSVLIDPGVTVDTKGTWYEISSGISRDAKGFILCIGNRNNQARELASYYWNIDVGVGAVASEKVILSNWSIATYSASNELVPIATPFMPIHIPSGTRISVRAACNGNDAIDRLFDAAIYTFS